MNRGRKIATILISLLGAVILWLYVVTNVATEVTLQLEVPITLEGITITEDGMIIQDGRMLKITEQSADTLVIGIRTSRVSRSKLNKDNVRVSIDARPLALGGSMSLPCNVNFPETVHDAEIISKSEHLIDFTVVEFDERRIPINLVWTGDVQQGYYFDSEKALPEPEELHVIGPKKELDKIAKAVVNYDISGLQETATVTLPVVLLNEHGQEITLSEQSTVTPAEAELTLPILRRRELSLALELLEGGGVKKENANVILNPESISVKGSGDIIDQLNEVLILDAVDLSTLPATWEWDYTLNLPEGVTSISGETNVHAVIHISGVSHDDIVVSDIRPINAPEGFKALITTKEVQVQVRGAASEVRELARETEHGIYIRVDLAGYTQTGAYTVQGQVINQTHPELSVPETVEIGVEIIQDEPEPEPESEG